MQRPEQVSPWKQEANAWGRGLGMGPRGDLEGQFNGPGGPSWGGRNVLELDSSNDVLLDTVDSVDVPDTVESATENWLKW